ncbi:hypothetical protein OESDEN_23328, partial [Oesophagostomum dentatum]
PKPTKHVQVPETTHIPQRPASPTEKPGGDVKVPVPSEEPIASTLKPTAEGPVIEGYKPIIPAVCKIGNRYRADFYVALRRVNPNMKWNCSLEESAFRRAIYGKQPPSGVDELRIVSSPFSPLLDNPERYIEFYLWSSHAEQILNARSFGCYLDSKTADDVKGRNEWIIYIIFCHFLPLAAAPKPTEGTQVPQVPHIPQRPASTTEKPDGGVKVPVLPEEPIAPTLKPTGSGEGPVTEGYKPIIPAQCKIGNRYRVDFYVALRTVNPNMVSYAR